LGFCTTKFVRWDCEFRISDAVWKDKVEVPGKPGCGTEGMEEERG
jgi:hypothetical protein